MVLADDCCSVADGLASTRLLYTCPPFPQLACSCNTCTIYLPHDAALQAETAGSLSGDPETLATSSSHRYSKRKVLGLT